MYKLISLALACSLGSAAVTMIQDKDRWMCPIYSNSLIGMTEISYTDSGIIDPDFCKKMCISQTHTYFSQIPYDNLCCSLVDMSAVGGGALCVLAYGSAVDDDNGFSDPDYDGYITVSNALYTKPSIEFMCYF